MNKKTKKIIGKLTAALPRYKSYIYPRLKALPCRALDTQEHLRSVPNKKSTRPIQPGETWGEMWSNTWFMADCIIDETLADQPLCIAQEVGGAEAMVFIDGQPQGILDPFALALNSDSANNQEVNAMAMVKNHPVCRLDGTYRKGDRLEIALEAYAGHPRTGCHPNELTRNEAEHPALFEHLFQGLFIHGYTPLFSDFYYDLKILLQLAAVLDPNTLRHARCLNLLENIYILIPQLPDEESADHLTKAVQEARQAMEAFLTEPHPASAPEFSLIGHSHMDTAWLWTLDETIRKCGRTFGNALRMMDQYPEYHFFQSSPYHLELARERYPKIHARILERAHEGRYEINGGTYIEPDCNIPSGEALVRNFILGNQVLQTAGLPPSDVFWLPDTFGYSAALPQILRQCGIRAFFTSKMEWNDTTEFPLDTFRWRGIDGTEIMTHFTTVHRPPDVEQIVTEWNEVNDKNKQDFKLLPFGYGDGGGGPGEDFIELARRCADLEGCPRATYCRVSDFVQKLENEMDQWPVWVGELYLELHRGTLTTIHDIKRGNRKAEIALRDAEILWEMVNPTEQPNLSGLWKTLLINQFHDILPGTSIPEVHDRARRELDEVTATAEQIAADAIHTTSGAAGFSIANTLSWPRESGLLLPAGCTSIPDHPAAGWQTIKTVENESQIYVAGLTLPALSIAGFPTREVAQEPPAPSVFKLDGNTLKTPHLVVEFDEVGAISRCHHRATGRELVGKGKLWNRFLCGEDVPALWDNWDIDTDQTLKMQEQTDLIDRKIVSDGALQFRIQTTHSIGQHSRATQIMVFYADSPRIDFETLVDWQETHRLLKVSFPTRMLSTQVRHEIQFGHLSRPTHVNREPDQAQFERSQHKWSDLSENRFGIALLNDCKYGVGILDGEFRLTLIKSGGHPDHRGDHGSHRMDYAILPHEGGFTTEAVIRPAYEFNMPPRIGTAGQIERTSLLEIDVPNLIVEAIKPAENGPARVIRLYETEGSATAATLDFNQNLNLEESNLLENNRRQLATDTASIKLWFNPFEIKTLVCTPAEQL